MSKKPKAKKVNVSELLAKYREVPPGFEAVAFADEEDALAAKRPAHQLRKAMVQVSGYTVKPYWRRKQDKK